MHTCACIRKYVMVGANLPAPPKSDRVKQTAKNKIKYNISFTNSGAPSHTMRHVQRLPLIPFPFKSSSHLTGIPVPLNQLGDLLTITKALLRT